MTARPIATLAGALTGLLSVAASAQDIDGCEVIDRLELEHAVLIACADGRYVELVGDEATVRVLGRLPPTFQRFVRVGDEVELEVLDRLPLTTAEVPRVQAVEGRRVRLDGGDFAVGERVALVDARRRSRQVMAVGRVVEPGTVEVGVGEVVPRGAMAAPTERATTADPWAPPRFGNVWQVTLGVRPLLSVNQGMQGGFTGSLALRYRAKGYFTVTTEVDPIGLTPRVTLGGLAVHVVAYTMLGFDLPMVELTVGVGLTSDPEGCCGAPAFALAQRLRVGAVDGLNVEATLVEGLSNVVRLHSLSVRAQLPLEPFGVRDVWLVARGAGGAAGYGLGELGARMLLAGNGWRGSFYLTVTAGALFTVWQVFSESGEHLGPSLGVEIEGRF